MMDEREIERLRSLGLTDEAIRSEAERRQRGQLGDSMPDDGGQSAESQQATPGGAERGRGGSAYPVTLNIEYPERLNRWLIFVKWLFVIPAYIAYALISGGGFNLSFVRGGGFGGDTRFAISGAGSIVLGTALVILFRGYFPRWVFDFQVALFRWSWRITSYFALLRDEYPPVQGEHPVWFDVEYPERLNRWLVLVKWLLLFPHYVVLFFLYIVLLATSIISWFSILFTRRYPPGLFTFAVGVFRWSARVQAYLFLMRDEYPPFSLT